MSDEYDKSPSEPLSNSPPEASPDLSPDLAAIGLKTGEDADPHLVLIPVEAEDVLRRRRRRIAAISLGAIVLGLLAWLFYTASVDPIKARESFDAGERMIKVGRYPQAILSFDRAIALKRNFSDAYWERGRGYQSLQQYDNAIRDFTKVIQILPNDGRPLADRGLVYLAQKDYESAIQDADRAIELDPKLAAGYALRGAAVRATGNVQASLADFDRAVKLEPNATNYFERGATYQLLGQHRLAIADFTEMIRYRPDAATGWFARAESERALGEMDAAKADHHQGRLIDGR